MTAEEAARLVANYLVGENMREFVQFTAKAGGFKIWSSGMNPPPDIQELLSLCTSSMSSTFKGSASKLRTRFLDQKLLEEDEIENLLDICDTFEDWVQLAFDKFSAKRVQLGKQMFDEIEDVRLEALVCYH